MNKDTIVQFSALGRTITLVSAEVKFIRIFAGDNRLTYMTNVYV